MRTKSLATLPLEQMASDTLEDIAWPEFRQALQQLSDASCCGAGSAGAMTVNLQAAPPAFVKLGSSAWLQTIKYSRHLLPVQSEPFVLPDVTIVEPEFPARQNVDIRVEKGRIARITPAGAMPAAPATIVEAVRGHVVCTALSDMHIHNPPSNIFNLTPLFLFLYLRHGIVRIREAGDTDGTGTPAAVALIESGAVPGIDLHYSYAFVQTGRARWTNSIHYDHPGQAEEIIRRLRHLGARWVKSYENLDVERVTALIAAARREGLGVLGHVPTKLRFEEASLPDTQHFFGVPYPHDLRRDHVLNRIIDWHCVTPARLSATVEICQRQGIAMTPTLSSGLNLLRLENYEAERQAADTRMLPDIYRDIIWHPAHGLPVFRNITKEDFRMAREASKLKLALTHHLWRAGVSLRLGTDVQQPFAVPGHSLHQEISAFETAGVPRAQCWKLASLDAARILGVDDTGNIQEGKRADLLTSPTSPLETAWSAGRMSAVIAGGHLMLARDLDAAIERQQARFRGAFARLTSRWLTQFAVARLARHFVP